jgi:hypothetical protein
MFCGVRGETIWSYHTKKGFINWGISPLSAHNSGRRCRGLLRWTQMKSERARSSSLTALVTALLHL